MTPYQIVSRYGTLVRSVAQKLSYQSGGAQDPDDLYQEGLMALLQSGINSEASENQTAAYVIQRATGAMRDSMRRLDNCSRHTRRACRQIEDARRRVRATDERAGAAAVAEAAGMSLAEYFKHRDRESEGFDTPLNELIEDRTAGDGDDPIDALQSAESRGQLDIALEHLPARYRTVVVWRFMSERTLADIASEIGVTEARVCQIERAAIRKMRITLAERGFY